MMTGTGSFVGSVIGFIAGGNDHYPLNPYIHLYLVSFVGGFIGGMIGSLERWSSNEEKYDRLINNNGPNDLFC
ncbi:hypothetical protein [Desulfosporosinus sp. SB140]|uniref:hypothetical protein n=1 Tax=Desulfosporosinus paludis TaxID=3115649 RepID=UPI00388F8E03